MIGSNVGALPPGRNVSRETEARIADFVALLIKWNAAINLVSKTTIGDVWNRHIVDCLQVFDYGQKARHWADLGSGGGLPGLVVAILALEAAPEMVVTLVEADQRKAAFLRQAGQMLGLKVRVISERIESLSPLGADVLSARALAPLSQLCAFADRHLLPDGRAIFLKGKSAADEVADARKLWQFALETRPSITDPSSSVLLLKEITLA